jgi:hypothetical protein
MLPVASGAGKQIPVTAAQGTGVDREYGREDPLWPSDVRFWRERTGEFIANYCTSGSKPSIVRTKVSPPIIWAWLQQR